MLLWFGKMRCRNYEFWKCCVLGIFVFFCNCFKDIKEFDCNNFFRVIIFYFYFVREDSRKWDYFKGMSKERGELIFEYVCFVF